MATLVIKNGLNVRSNDSSPASAVYDQEGYITWSAWLDSSDNLLPGSDTDGFDVNDTKGVGTYATTPVTWAIFGPDSLGAIVMGSGVGTVANKKTFTPLVPGRYLVRLTAHKYIADPVNVGGPNILEEAPDEFSVVVEIRDPSVLGVTSTDATSIMALNEKNEYDPDEGWGRTIERYLSTVSKMAGGRRIASGVNRAGATVDIGKPVTLHSDCLKEWKGSVPSLVDYQNYNLQFNLADGADDSILTAPIFLTLHDSVAANERSYLLVDGIIPYDTAALGAVAGVGETLYVNDLKELSITSGTYERRVGKVLVVGTDTGAVPGSIEFDGSSSSAHVHAASIFAESNNPIKAIPPVGKVGGVGQNVREWLTEVFFPFIPAALSFSADSYQEKGLTSNNVVLNGNVVAHDETTFSNYELKEGTTVIASSGASTLTLPTNASPPSTANQYWTFTHNVIVNKTYTINLTVHDKVVQTLTASNSLLFYYPTYYAAGPSGLTEAQIKTGAYNDGKSIKSSRASSHSYTVVNGHFYLAYPQSFNALTSIKDPNNFEVLGSMTRTTPTWTTPDSAQVPYYVYEWTAPTTQTNFQLIFS
tara:strand:- start:238 stop:2004 length:1767 start_codon:yes stop_codon:yes gene_type:complete